MTAESAVVVVSALRDPAAVFALAVLLIAAVALGAGAYILLLGGRTVRIRIRSGRTEPEPVDTVTPNGYVEVVGEIDELNTDPVVAPFSGTECAAYEYRLRQQDGTTWQVAEGADATEFIVGGGVGNGIEVRPESTPLNAEWTTVARPDAGESLPESSRAALESHPEIDTAERPEYFASEASSLRAYEERRLDTGEEVYVHGNASTEGVYDGRIDGAQSSEFAMGTEPAGSFGGSLGQAVLQLLLGVGAVLAGAVGLWFALERLGVALPAVHIAPGIDAALAAVVSSLAWTAAVAGGTTGGAGSAGITVAGLDGAATAVAGVIAVGGTGGAAIVGGGTPPVLLDGVHQLPVLSISTDMLLMGGIGLLVAILGLYFGWKGLSELWIAVRIFVNQPVDPGEAALLDGVVELEGTVQSADDGTVESPYAGDDAALADVRVRRREKERVRTRDSDGNRKTKTRHTWNTKATGSYREPFRVESDGTTIEVDPAGADVTLGEYETIHEQSDDSMLPESVRLRLSAGKHRGINDPSSFLSQTTTNRQRFQERTLAVGDAVHVYGGDVVDESTPEPTVINGSDEYSISAGTELRTVLRRVIGALPSLVLSAALLAVAGIVLSAAVGGVV